MRATFHQRLEDPPQGWIEVTLPTDWVLTGMDKPTTGERVIVTLLVRKRVRTHA